MPQPVNDKKCLMNQNGIYAVLNYQTNCTKTYPSCRVDHDSYRGVGTRLMTTIRLLVTAATVARRSSAIITSRFRFVVSFLGNPVHDVSLDGGLVTTAFREEVKVSREDFRLTQLQDVVVTSVTFPLQ